MANLAKTSAEFFRAHRLSILFSLIYLSFFSIQFYLRWPLLQMWNASDGSGQSADGQVILDIIDCYGQAGLGGYFLESAFQDCPPYIYGISFPFIFYFLGLGPSSILILSWLFILTVSIILALLTAENYKRSGPYLGWLSVFISLSPPIQLLLQRANFDVVVFVTLFLAGVLVISGQRHISFLLLAVAASMKFYSLFAISVLTLWVRSRKAFWVFLAGQVASTSLVAFELLRRRASLEFIPEDGGASFGITVLPRIWNIGVQRLGLPGPISDNFLVFAGLVLFLPAILAVLGLQAKTGFLDLVVDSYRQKNLWIPVGIFSGVTFVSCYLAGTNYDYRLIFLIPFGLWVAAFAGNRRWLRALLLGSLAVSFWFSFIPGPVQVFGDLVLAFWGAIGVITLAKLALISLRQFRESNWVNR